MRRRLFGIAYRILGVVAEAEDVVQECWLRWQGADRGTVQDPAAYLVTIATRLAINAADSARVRRESYLGVWLPEPVDTREDPYLGAAKGEALKLAALLLLEKLNGPERAAFVLREAFDYAYEDIAEILEVRPDHARQIVSRARKNLGGQRSFPVPQDAETRMLEALLKASRAGDLAALETMLAEDAVSLSDGGGKTPAARYPLLGRDRVGRMLAALGERFWSKLHVQPLMANGQVCAWIERDGRPFALLDLSGPPGAVRQLLWVMNPEKLAHLAAVTKKLPPRS